MKLLQFDYNFDSPPGTDPRLLGADVTIMEDVTKRNQYLRRGYLIANPRTGELVTRTVFLMWEMAQEVERATGGMIIQREWWEDQNKTRIALPKIDKQARGHACERRYSHAQVREVSAQ